MLQLPDYTSREKTYALITQVAGRAGRADTGGRVLLQTYTPNHYAIADAVSYSYDDFYSRDLAVREKGLYPPFARILRLVFTGEDQNTVKSTCHLFFQGLRKSVLSIENSKDCIIYFNMMTAPISRINGMYRYQILLKLHMNEHTQIFENVIFDSYNQFENEKVYLDVEVDPLSLY